MSKKILTAMSGGVDSSVAALLLKKQGYEVIGIFMNFWSSDTTCANKCCSVESVRSARQIASRLNIRLYNLNYKELFKKNIVDYYLSGIKNSKTPNPCAICNKVIKFGKLLKIAEDLGANYISTGHYARIKKNENKFELHRSVDLLKDQSYFLWQIPQISLSRIIFPIGDFTKTKVRKIAEENNLEVFNKKDSQGLCFVGNSNTIFLSKYLKNSLNPGNVADLKGSIIGRHKGLCYYTIGQRTGFTLINDKWRKSGIDAPPLYVIKKDPAKNILIVDEDKYTYRSSFNINQANWFEFPFLKSKNKTTWAQIRYQHPVSKCTITKIKDDETKVEFVKPQRAITPGQSCVFYDKTKVIGGGFIE